MSPKEFHALNRAYNERVEHMDWQFAGLKATIAQCHGCKVTAADFMSMKEKMKVNKYPSDKQLERSLEIAFGCGPTKAKKGQ